MIRMNLQNTLFAACRAPRIFANPALRSVSGTEYCGIVNGRYFPCLFSITWREIVVGVFAVFVIAIGGICTAMIRIGTCICCNGKFCTTTVRREYPSFHGIRSGSSLPNERDFPREALKSIKAARFRSSDLSSFRETAGAETGGVRRD